MYIHITESRFLFLYLLRKNFKNLYTYISGKYFQFRFFDKNFFIYLQIKLKYCLKYK